MNLDRDKRKQLRICCICKKTAKKHDWLPVAERCKDCQPR